MTHQQDPPPQPSRLQVVATAMAASVFLLPVLLGKLFELIIKAINPDDVNVGSGLAYLRPLIIVTFSLMGIWFVTTLVSTFLLQRREGAAARTVWIVLGVQVVLGLSFLVVQSALDGIIDQ